MKILKKNQVVIYVIALMLVVAGYLNYTPTGEFDSAILTSSNIGDAQLVSSESYSDSEDNDAVEENIVSVNENEFVLENNIVETNSELKKDSDYFTTSKLEREKMYSQMIETYENMLNSNNSLETQKQSAQEEIVKINNIKNSIMICENLIKTKGIDDIVIFVNGNSISVIVDDEQLDKEEVAQIQNIISREIGAKPENIHISNK